MKKIAFIALVLLTACKSKNESPDQTNRNNEIMFPFGDTAFSWKGIEKQDAMLKAKFVKLAPTLLKDEYEFYNNSEHSKNEFEGNCHAVDINDDGLNDIIYTGSSGGEGQEVTVFLNTKKGFQSVFKQIQYIKKLEFKDNKLYRLYIVDDGCCTDYNDFNWIYQAAYSDNNMPQFKTIYLTANTHNSYFPNKYFNHPVYFEVLNNDYKMRYSAAIDDTTKNGMGGIEFIGNNIDTLTKGTKGRAIASQMDKTSRIWWLVEIDSAYDDYGNLFYEQPDSKYRSSKMGWISSRYVKRINK